MDKFERCAAAVTLSCLRSRPRACSEYEEAQEELKEAQATIQEAQEDIKDPEAAIARAQADVEAAEAKLSECRK